MDNITHSLVGACLARTGLARKSGLAMPAMVAAANLPDIDMISALAGGQSLAVHRGFTHGLGGVALLPPLLAGGLVALDRWQGRRGTRPAARLPVNPLWLVVLCWLAALTHPALDWLNTYGVRLLEPFSHRWFYGDTLFIADLWLWLMLGMGLWRSHARQRAGRVDWAVPARIAGVAALAYVALNLGLSIRARDAVEEAYRGAHGRRPDMVVACPQPLAFWRREVMWRAGEAYGAVPVGPDGRLAGPLLPLGRTGMDDPRVEAWAMHSPAAIAFLFWSRMPLAMHDGNAIVLSDQRFLGFAPRGSRQSALAVRLIGR